MHILLAFFMLIFMPNSLIKSLRKKFIFSKSLFQPSSYKHISDVFFRFRMISERYFGSRHGFSIFFKKVSKSLFVADLLTSSEYSTFSSQIVGYGQTVIGTLQSGSRRCFHIPIMIPYHVQIQFSNSRKKNFKFHFLCIFP